MKVQERHNRFVSEIELRAWRGDIPAESVGQIFIAYAQACHPSHYEINGYRTSNSRWAVLSEELRKRFHSLQSTRLSAKAGA